MQLFLYWRVPLGGLEIPLVSLVNDCGKRHSNFCCIGASHLGEVEIPLVTLVNDCKSRSIFCCIGASHLGGVEILLVTLVNDCKSRSIFCCIGASHLGGVEILLGTLVNAKETEDNRWGEETPGSINQSINQINQSINQSRFPTDYDVFTLLNTHLPTTTTTISTTTTLSSIMKILSRTRWIGEQLKYDKKYKLTQCSESS